MVESSSKRYSGSGLCEFLAMVMTVLIEPPMILRTVVSYCGPRNEEPRASTCATNSAVAPAGSRDIRYVSIQSVASLDNSSLGSPAEATRLCPVDPPTGWRRDHDGCDG